MRIEKLFYEPEHDIKYIILYPYPDQNNIEGTLIYWPSHATFYHINLLKEFFKKNPDIYEKTQLVKENIDVDTSSLAEQRLASLGYLVCANISVSAQHDSATITLPEIVTPLQQKNFENIFPILNTFSDVDMPPLYIEKVQGKGYKEFEACYPIDLKNYLQNEIQEKGHRMK